MSGNSQKKNQIIYDKYSKYIFIATYIFYLIKIIEVLYKYFFTNLIFWDWVLFFVYNIVIKLSSDYILRNLKLGVDINLFVDIFAAAYVLNFISMYTYKIFYVLYILPLGLLYYLLKKCWSFVSTEPVKKEDVELDKKNKKNKNQEKERVKYRKY